MSFKRFTVYEATLIETTTNQGEERIFFSNIKGTLPSVGPCRFVSANYLGKCVFPETLRQAVY